MPAAASSRRSSRRLRARIGPLLPTGIRSSADTPAVAQLGGHQQRQQGAVTGRQPVQRRLRPVVPVPGGDELFRRPVRGGGIRVGQPPPAWGPAQAPRAPSRAAGAASSAATNPPGPGPAASPGAPPGAAARELLTAQQAGMAPEVLAGGSRRRWATRWPCWNCPRSVTAASPSSRCASGDGWNTRSGDGSRRCRHPPGDAAGRGGRAAVSGRAVPGAGAGRPFPRRPGARRDRGAAGQRARRGALSASAGALGAVPIGHGYPAAPCRPAPGSQKLRAISRGPAGRRGNEPGG